MSDVKLKAICSECRSDQVYYDKHHAEIYCRQCGLVLVQLHSITIHNLLNDYNFNDFKESQTYNTFDEVYPGYTKTHRNPPKRRYKKR